MLAQIDWHSKRLNRITQSLLESAFHEEADDRFLVSSLVQEIFRMTILPLIQCYTDKVSLMSLLTTSSIVSDKISIVDVARLREMVSEGKARVH